MLWLLPLALVLLCGWSFAKGYCRAAFADELGVWLECTIKLDGFGMSMRPQPEMMTEKKHDFWSAVDLTEAGIRNDAPGEGPLASAYGLGTRAYQRFGRGLPGMAGLPLIASLALWVVGVLVLLKKGSTAPETEPVRAREARLLQFAALPIFAAALVLLATAGVEAGSTTGVMGIIALIAAGTLNLWSLLYAVGSAWRGEPARRMLDTLLVFPWAYLVVGVLVGLLAP